MSECILPLKFTVFTPTYNRAHTLGRVYESLCVQTYRSFQWLVVDDGSTDGTELLLSKLLRTAPFPIRVMRTENGGKHRAHNAAIKDAQSELFVILDSDDELTIDSLSILNGEWERIPNQFRCSFAGILGNSISSDKTMIGCDYAEDFVDGKLFELVSSGILLGEKLPCYRTEVLRDYPFPERLGCKALVPEGVVWSKISAKYQVRLINKNVRIYHKDSNDPIALMNSYKRPDSNAWGGLQYCVVVLNLAKDYWPRFFLVFVKSSINCTRFALHSKSNVLSPLSQIENPLGRALWLTLFPAGIAFWFLDLIHMWIRRAR
jgi:glycosyltransferase involved in cell wall biosynthesis